MGLNHQQYNTRYVLNLQNGGEPLNDAAASYGVKVVEADAAEGETYWRVIGVHHLLPRENFSKHNIYLEALDENGQRIKNPPISVGWTWVGRRAEERANPVLLDKPDSEAAGNISVHFGQIVSVWINQDKSDQVINLHTNHPDEPLPDGSLLNTIGHHSFYIVFQRTKKATASDGVIAGRVDRGQGQSIRLIRNGQVIDEQIIANNSTYRFENLPAGLYRLDVAGAGINQDNIRLDTANKDLVINLALPVPTQSVVAGQVTNGQGRMLLLVKEGNIIARMPIALSGEYRFESLGEGVYSVMVFETNVRQDNIALDGSNSRQVNLTVPAPWQVPEEEPSEKPINHYLLFGPPDTRGRQTNLLLATDYILHFSVTVGFSITEAKQAQHVTVVGEGVSQTAVQVLEAAGCEVEVISGDAYDIEARLLARLRAGRAFG